MTSLLIRRAVALCAALAMFHLGLPRNVSGRSMPVCNGGPSGRCAVGAPRRLQAYRAHRIVFTSLRSTVAFGAPTMPVVRGGRSSTISRPVRSARSPLHRAIRSVIYAGAVKGFQRPDLSVGNGIYKSHRWRQHVEAPRVERRAANSADRRRSQRSRTGCSSRCSDIRTDPNPERGVYRSTDGGATFTRVLYRDDNTGAYNVRIDPSNPQVVYATLWAARQAPWEVGGSFEQPGSGIFKSTDGGDHWTRLPMGLPGGNGTRRDRDRTLEPAGRVRLRRRRTAAPAVPCSAAMTAARISPRRATIKTRLANAATISSRIAVDPKDPQTLYLYEHLDLSLHRRRQAFYRDQGRAGRRRLSERLDQPGQSRHHRTRERSGRDDLGRSRRDMEFVVQPADGADVSREYG